MCYLSPSIDPRIVIIISLDPAGHGVEWDWDGVGKLDVYSYGQISEPSNCSLRL